MSPAPKYSGPERRAHDREELMSKPISLVDSQRIAALIAEVAAIHRDNERRDKAVEDVATDVKTLLALANQSKGGIWVGMSIASVIGSIMTWAATHLVFRG